jgi:hypothetical protein
MPLNDSELIHLVHFTDEGEAVDKAGDKFLAVMKLPGGTLRQNLKRFKDALVASGIRGKGQDKNAHEEINTVIQDFQVFLDSLSEDTRDQLLLYL